MATFDIKNLDLRLLAEHVMKNAKDVYRNVVGTPPAQKAIFFMQRDNEPAYLETEMRFTDDAEKMIVLNEIVDRAINIKASAFVLVAHCFMIESACKPEELDANRRMMRRALELRSNLSEAIVVSVLVPGAKPFFVVQEITRVDNSIQFFVEPQEYGDFAFYEEDIFKPYINSPTPHVV